MVILNIPITMPIPQDFKVPTPRLLLIPISLDYKDVIFKELTEEVARFLLVHPTGDIQDTINFINNSLAQMAKGEKLQLVALDKETKEFLGCISLKKMNTPIPEIGLWLKKSVWGKGYGKESTAALKKWADDNLDYDKILYPAYKINTPSRKIAEFLGGKMVREFIGKNKRGEEFEEVEYLIDKG